MRGARSATGGGQAEPVVRILGIDPGTIHCGYGLIDVTGAVAFGRPRYVECGVLELPARDTLSERLRLLATDLRELIAEYAPAELALESVFHGVNAQSALKLGHARGVVMLCGAEAGLPLAEYPPATVKRAVAGNGRAQKAEVGRMVSVLCGLGRAPSADAADALAVAICHAQHRTLIETKAALLAQASRARSERV